MEETVKAVYENGNFRPLEPLKIQLDEGQVVKLIIIKIEEDEEHELNQKEKKQD